MQAIYSNKYLGFSQDPVRFYIKMNKQKEI